MKENWKMSNWTLAQMERRDFEPEVEEGCIINGCIPQDDYAEQVFELAKRAGLNSPFCKKPD